MRTATVSSKGRVLGCHIRPARYAGVYSQAKWHAWPVESMEHLPGAAYGSDLVCGQFWAEQKKTRIPMVGKGPDPSEALSDLREKLRGADQHTGGMAPERKDPLEVPGLAWYHRRAQNNDQ